MERVRIEIRGIVQGVGFRPFIHRLVAERGLNGYIKNTSSGVELELEGPEAALERFLEELPRRAPALAVIESVETRRLDGLAGYQGFEIRRSRTDPLRDTLISPDICVCEDCLRELRDPADRRYRYPFINCTNCGPRFTIIKDVPYDRAKTSMEAFPMCPDCSREYHDIENRRYHAQPDCCPDCGPRVFYLDGQGREQPGDAIERARALLKSGGILAVKGLGGIHLACSCESGETARLLRQRKQRDEKPFALMCRDAAAARELCLVSPAEEKLLTSRQRPIVLLKKRRPGWEAFSENGRIGVMLPYTPLHVLLMGEDLPQLVMTSANLSDLPILTQNKEAVERLRGIADGFLLHDRDIQTRCDDSLCWELDGEAYFARRSRGYVPYPVQVPGCRGGILACGAEQKASFCLSRGEHVFPSQHIGDLKNLETLEHYEQQIRHFERLFDIRPELLACDLHPDYLSTAYALRRGEEEGLPVIQVQHHHAHMAACMADNGLQGPVIGLIWDGTGLGPDGTAWGGECLVGDYERFERFASLRPLRLIGGDKAVWEPERTAWFLLQDAGCDTGAVENGALYEAVLRSGLNCPVSTGMGRLFDGVSALLGIKRRCSYEGQGAILLEAAAGESGEAYPFTLDGEPLRFDWRPMVRALTADRARGVPAGLCAAKFMNTLIEMAAACCLAASRATGIQDVVLSGGSFQNMYLMERLPGALRARGLRPWHHRRVSANDEGISLGQLMVAQARAKGEETHVPCGTPEINRG